jgi:hypothetical protein
MEEMNPLVGMRLGHPKELSWHFLNGVLFHIGQDAEELVDQRGSGTGVIRTGAAARAGLSINGVILHIGHKRVLERGEQPHEFCFREAGHRP